MFGALLVVAAVISNSRDKADMNASIRSSRVARGENPDATPENKPATASVTISADDLSARYEENEVAADRAYKGRRVAVSGTIDRVGKDILNTMYVVLEGSRLDVQCMFGDEYETALANLSKGQRVTLVGEVQGKMMNVILRDCALR